MKKLALIFPEIGYTCAKPLLYYTASAAEEQGYEVKRLDYGRDIHTIKGRAMDQMEPVIALAVQRTAALLKDTDWRAYGDILMISKSIGTVVACRLAREKGIRCRQFLITPIPATLPYLPEIEGCFLAGTSDPYISEALVREAAEKYPEKVGALFEGCDHSLERKGDTQGNIRNVLETVNCLKALQSSPRLL